MISTPPSESRAFRPELPEQPEPNENPRDFEKRRIDWVLTHYLPGMSPEEIAQHMLRCWDIEKYHREAIQHRDKKFGEIAVILGSGWSK